MNSPKPALQPGLAVIHANKLESLREMVVAWIRAHPLKPLENEVLLVQSNGMSQWLKIALAEEVDGLGICACVDAQLPGRLLWSAYKTVLDGEDIPEVPPFDRTALTWRVYRLLPDLLNSQGFDALRQFLSGETDSRKRYQLAECLANLLDRYQTYRPDWLRDWALGRLQLRDAFGESQTLPPEQWWQAKLWRAILDDMPEAHRQINRALLQERFLAALAQTEHRPPGLPRRIVVFGISSLPRQMLEAIAALGRFCQVLVCVHNPCRYYWADIVEHKQLLRTERHRLPLKASIPKALDDDQLYLHSHPLLAAWGRQGRDFVKLLDEFDESAHYRDCFQRIDLFEDFGQTSERSLLKQIQQAVLELEPLPHGQEQRTVADHDGSIIFQIAHGPQREVEILHDHLLALFEQKAKAGESLPPRDIIVMVPDIDLYAPHISSVFGQIEANDSRYIPYSLTDLAERGQNPLLVALESLLHLPQSRFTVSDLLDLLDVPAVRGRFAIAEDNFPTLRQWIREAGVRWGLDAPQREGFGLAPELEQNSWRFGLRRMLLGYAVGEGEPFAGIEPYDEVGGLAAALVGPLADLLDKLGAHWRTLHNKMTPLQWTKCLRQLLDDFFYPASDRDQNTLERLEENLTRFEEICVQVGLNEALPLTVVREAWLSGLDEPSLTQRFLAGRVNFCSLLPMRAIPFKVVCLMGMNDGDFPRCHLPPSFDLMSPASGYRPGDRSRRDDDHYLFLEALLSARERLYISWVGRSAQDNSERPPSLLVSQLRDYLANGWRLDRPADEGSTSALLEKLTVEHPLQAFSTRYFLPPLAEGYDERLFSYAREWRSAHEAAMHIAGGALPSIVREAPLTLDILAGFLRHPVKAFFNDRLKIRFEREDFASEDVEPFVFDRLQEYTLGMELLDAALDAKSDAQASFDSVRLKQIRRGQLPMAGFASLTQKSFANAAWAAYECAIAQHRRWPLFNAPLHIALDFGFEGETLHLEDWLHGLRSDGQGRFALVLARPQQVHTNEHRPKWHNLAAPWVRHLAACAAGAELLTLQAGPDGVVELPPINPATARSWLEDLVEAWRLGMGQPLPLACKTGFAILGQQDPRREYEGGYQYTGEVQQDPYLARAYPNYACLSQTIDDAHRGLAFWTERLYQPIWETLSGGLA